MTSTSFAPTFRAMAFDAVPNDERRIVHASLTSATDIDGGTLVGSNPDHTINGLTTGGGGGYYTWTPTAAQITALQDHSHIHFELENTWFDETIAINEYMIGLGTSNTASVFLQTDGTIKLKIDGVATAIHDEFDRSSREESSHDSFDIIMTPGQKIFYWNGRLISSVSRAIISNAFSKISIMSSGSGSLQPDFPQRLKNFYVVAGVAAMDHVRGLSNIYQFGDSLTVQGNKIATQPGQNGTAGNNADAMTITIQGNLAKQNIEVNPVNEGVSGDQVSDLQTLLNSHAPLAGAVAVVIIGINDVGGGSWNKTTYQTELQTAVNTLLNTLDASQVILCNLTTPGPATILPLATYGPLVDEANVAILAVANATTNVTHVDLFNLFGGHTNFLLEDFQTDNFHWSAKGSRKAGRAIANTILAKRGTL